MPTATEPRQQQQHLRAQQQPMASTRARYGHLSTSSSAFVTAAGAAAAAVAAQGGIQHHDLDPDHELLTTMASIFSIDEDTFMHEHAHAPMQPQGAPHARMEPHAEHGHAHSADRGGEDVVSLLPVLKPTGRRRPGSPPAVAGTPARLLRRRGLSLDMPGAHRELAESLAAAGALTGLEEAKAFSSAFERLAVSAAHTANSAGAHPHQRPDSAAAAIRQGKQSPGGAVAAIQAALADSSSGSVVGQQLPAGYEGIERVAGASKYMPRPGHLRSPDKEGFFEMGGDAPAAPEVPQQPVAVQQLAPTKAVQQGAGGVSSSAAAASGVEGMTVRDLLGLLVSTLQQQPGVGGGAGGRVAGGGGDVADMKVGQLLLQRS